MIARVELRRGFILRNCGQNYRDNINDIVLFDFLHDLRIAAVFADARDLPLVRAVRLLDPTGFRDGKSVVLVAIGVLCITCASDTICIAASSNFITVVVNCPLAIFPNFHTVNVNFCFASVIFYFPFPAEAKQAGTGEIICAHAGNTIIPCDVQDILIVAHIAVIDVQHRFQTVPGIGDRAIPKVDGNIIFPGAEICIDVNNFSRCPEFAVIKRHRRRRIGPNSVVSRRADKRGVRKRRGGIAPVEGLTFDGTIFDNSID